MFPINPWLIGAAAFAAIAVFSESNKKDKDDEDGNNRKDGGGVNGDDCGGKQSPADSQHHGQNLVDPTGGVYDQSKVDKENDDEQVSPDSERIDAVGSGDSGNDCGGEPNPPAKTGG